MRRCSEHARDDAEIRNRRERRRFMKDDICLSSVFYLFYGGLDGRCSEHARDDAKIPLKPSPHLPSYPTAYLSPACRTHNRPRYLDVRNVLACTTNIYLLVQS